jgi:ABC-type uncharacterized transport system ATPase subunit
MITPRIPRRHVQDDVADIVSRTSGVPTLEVSDLVKRYGDVLALYGCSLQVPAGHLVGLLGPNGAGKTTVMRTLAGRMSCPARSADPTGFRKAVVC